MIKGRTAEINLAGDFERRALVVEDFDEAVGAIRELKKVNKDRALSVALRILDEGIGDVYYQAAAFRELYEISVADAVSYVAETATTVNAYILGAMLTCVSVDAGHLENQAEVKKAVAALRHALDLRSIEDIEQIQEEKIFFEEAFH